MRITARMLSMSNCRTNSSVYARKTVKSQGISKYKRPLTVSSTRTRQTVNTSTSVDKYIKLGEEAELEYRLEKSREAVAAGQPVKMKDKETKSERKDVQDKQKTKQKEQELVKIELNNYEIINIVRRRQRIQKKH